MSKSPKILSRFLVFLVSLAFLWITGMLVVGHFINFCGLIIKIVIMSYKIHNREKVCPNFYEKILPRHHSSDETEEYHFSMFKAIK